jgi:hypothetical protein
MVMVDPVARLVMVHTSLASNDLQISKLSALSRGTSRDAE